MPTSTAAAPTKLCKIATNSGIEVMATREATIAPITTPGTTAATKMLYPDPVTLANAVAPTAITMPMMPYRFPFRAVS